MLGYHNDINPKCTAKFTEQPFHISTSHAKHNHHQSGSLNELYESEMLTRLLDVILYIINILTSQNLLVTAKHV
jgi:hypothetical protein